MGQVYGGVGQGKAAGDDEVGGDEAEKDEDDQLAVPAVEQAFEQPGGPGAVGRTADDVQVNGQGAEEGGGDDAERGQGGDLPILGHGHGRQIGQAAEVVQADQGEHEPPQVRTGRRGRFHLGHDGSLFGDSQGRYRDPISIHARQKEAHNTRVLPPVAHRRRRGEQFFWRARLFCIIAMLPRLKQETAMCGIVGYLDKRPGADRCLGQTLLAMLQALGCRGPDSAGVAVFGGAAALLDPANQGGRARAGAGLPGGGAHGGWNGRPCWRPRPGGPTCGWKSRAPLAVPQLEDYLLLRVPGAEVVSLGRSLEVLKQVGSPTQLDQTYDIASRRGSHGIGHTRLSTESRVDLSHSQPFWAHGVPDLVTVHNGHITNYHKLRRRYEQRGYRFFTENDSEVIGVYLRDRLAAGLTLPDALRSSLDDFDGSFCYLAASEDYLAFVKDRFGFKPLMLAETDAFVALATEEIALRQATGPRLPRHRARPRHHGRVVGQRESRGSSIIGDSYGDGVHARNQRYSRSCFISGSAAHCHF